MSKKLMVLALILVFVLGSGQNDSASAIRFSGVQAGFLGLFTYNNDNSLSRANMRKFIGNDQLLNADLSHCDSSSGANYMREYNGGGGFKIFASLPKLKRSQLDIFAGVYFNTNTTMYANYYNTIYDTVNVYSSAAGNLYEISENSDQYSFTLSSKQVLMPMGITISSDKQRRIWASTGLAISPGILTNYIFRSNNTVSSFTYVVGANVPREDYHTTGQKAFGFSFVGHNTTWLKMTGFTTYIYIPSSVNLRIAKKVKFLKHANLSFGLSPGYYFSRDKINGTDQSFALMMDLGMRFNF